MTASSPPWGISALPGPGGDRLVNINTNMLCVVFLFQPFPILGGK